MLVVGDMLRRERRGVSLGDFVEGNWKRVYYPMGFLDRTFACERIRAESCWGFEVICMGFPRRQSILRA